MHHNIEDLPRSDCTYSRHKENKVTSPIICWKSNLIFFSLIATINTDTYQQQREIRAASKVSKSLVKDARDKLAMTSLTQVLVYETLAKR
jgi:hypothetical protein